MREELLASVRERATAIFIRPTITQDVADDFNGIAKAARKLKAGGTVENRNVIVSRRLTLELSRAAKRRRLE